MQLAIAGQANIMDHDMVAKATGNPITAGTVNFYLVAKTGVNAGKWFRTSDDSWQAAEAAAGVGTHKADGLWQCSIDSAAWIDDVLYSLYAKEGGDLHIHYTENVVCGNITAAAVWDRLLTGATHNIPTSAGRRLRQAGQDATIVRENTCQAGGDVTNVILDLGASAEDGAYDHYDIIITDGTGAGQRTTIHEYDGTTKEGEVHPNWKTIPAADSEYIILSKGSVHVHEIETDALASIVAALMADTGFTAGGTMTFAEQLKIVAAWCAGKWQLKSGETNVYELLDADDGATVIMEMTLSQTTPFRTITIS